MKLIITEQHYKALFCEENDTLEQNDNLYQIPKETYLHLKNLYSKVKDNDKYTELDGYKRLQNIIESNGLLSYDWLRRIKNFFDHYKNQDIIYELNGGDMLKTFVNQKLRELTNKASTTSKLNKDLGLTTIYKGNPKQTTNHENKMNFSYKNFN